MKLYPDEAGGSSLPIDDAPVADETTVKKEEEKTPIFGHLERVSSTLNVAGPALYSE